MNYPLTLCYNCRFANLLSLNKFIEFLLKNLNREDSSPGSARCWPGITLMEARDTGDQAGMGVGDSILIQFSTDTNAPNVNSKEAIDHLIRFSASIGSSYTGTWETPKSLILTIASIG